MNGVLAAKTAVLLELDSVGIVLLVFHIVVIALFAFRAGKCDTRSHILCLLVVT